jgi:hypothetical protein
MHTIGHTLLHQWVPTLLIPQHRKATSSTLLPTLSHLRQPTTTDTRQTIHRQTTRTSLTILRIIPHLQQRAVLLVADMTNAIPVLSPIWAILLPTRHLLVTRAMPAMIAAGRVENM